MSPSLFAPNDMPIPLFSTQLRNSSSANALLPIRRVRKDSPVRFDRRFRWHRKSREQGIGNREVQFDSGFPWHGKKNQCAFLRSSLSVEPAYLRSAYSFFSSPPLRTTPAVSSLQPKRLAAPEVPVPKLPLSFEPNIGQADPHVKFLSRGPGYTLFLTEDEAVLALQKPEVRSQKSEEEGRSCRLSVVSCKKQRRGFVTRHLSRRTRHCRFQPLVPSPRPLLFSA